jgi:hypothetical protein
VTDPVLNTPSGSHPSLRNCCSWVSAAQDFDGVGCNYGILCYYGCTWHKQVTPAPPIEMIIFTNFHIFSLLGHPFFGSRSQLLQVCDPGHAGIFCAECPAGTYNPPGCPCPTRSRERMRKVCQGERSAANTLDSVMDDSCFCTLL